MNAKDTLKKIADALNITSKEDAKVETAVETPVVETVEAPIEDVKQVEETPVVETVEDVKETPETDLKEDAIKEDIEAKDAPEVKSEAIQNAEKAVGKAEEMKDEIKKEEPSELDLLKLQLNELKDIIKQQSEVPSIDEEPKGLIHNPEGNVSKKTTKIGNKGGDIVSRVYQYINR
tara:strand:- start:68 stop:595 length:528 start_codon:yes stop_codon:yes gene_type:complete